MYCTENCEASGCEECIPERRFRLQDFEPIVVAMTGRDWYSYVVLPH